MSSTPTLRPSEAIEELQSLKAQASAPQIRRSSPEHKSWTTKVETIMARSLGEDSAVLKKFRDVRYHVGVSWGGRDEAARDAAYFVARLEDALGLIDAAVYELELSNRDTAPRPLDYDEGLWQHVKHSVEEERWQQVASQAVIYVEDKVRRWAGQPTGKDGNVLVGQTLFALALGDGGPLALGKQSNETQGWRSLGTGLVAALGNVDRHHVQERPDARLYAMGVLGLASLLLTQLRHQHPTAAAADGGARRP